MKQSLLRWLRICLVLEMVLLLGLAAQPALAHTEDAIVQFALEPVGPYAMTVWTYPGTMRAGAVHYTVAVLDTAVAQPLKNANITITATPLDGQSQPVRGIALQGTDALYPDYYELDLVLSEKGAYRVDVQLQDGSGQRWLKAFQIEIVSAMFIKWVTLILLFQALLFTLWLMRESVQTWGLKRLFAGNASDWEKTRTRAKRPL